ncbi:hypothetical protein [Streptomyces sp. NPDC058683]|uniref:hypothetical protein n=1 Tax=Streptomyces sp. NPDC058683 TaxID=3346597 RepID=UPI0036584295
MDSQGQVCPVCGQTVGSVVRRHKTLGAWVPVWRPGPCRNPDCAENRTEEQPAPQPAPPESDDASPAR